jgi:hypothetical protein
MTTLVRTKVTLKDSDWCFDKASRVIDEWINSKAEPHGIHIFPQTFDYPREHARIAENDSFMLDFARADNALALAVEYPDPGADRPTWRVDLALTRLEQSTELAIRIGLLLDDPAGFPTPDQSGGVQLSVREGADLTVKRAVQFSDLVRRTSFPQEPRAEGSSTYRFPEVLRSIVDRVGVADYREMSSKPTIINELGIGEFFLLVDSPGRRCPVVAVSSRKYSDGGGYLADSAKLAGALAGIAHVVQLAPAYWPMKRHWGGDWNSVYSGAVRIYMPASVPSLGPYWVASDIESFNAQGPPGAFHSVCIASVFSQITEQFEKESMPTPHSIRASGSPRPGPITLGDLGPAAESSETASEDEEPRQQNQRLEQRVIELQRAIGASERILLETRSENARLEAELSQERKWVEEILDENRRLEVQLSASHGDPSLETSLALRPMWERIHSLLDSVQEVALRFRRMESECEEMQELKVRNQELRNSEQNLKATNESLIRRQPGVVGHSSSGEAGDLRPLVDIVPQLARGEIPLETSLKLMEKLFPGRVTVLDEAFDAARGSHQFRYKREAFYLLWQLATNYWQEVQIGGDAGAHKVFGDSYAACEAENLSKIGRNARTFEYQGKKVQMEKHLKIGVAESNAESLRIHFEWFADEKMIVIGHCGKHLPL